MLRHPSRRYIYYLFSKRTMDIEAIALHLRELQLPYPVKGEKVGEFVRSMVAARKQMRFPAGYDPYNPNPSTLAFLDKWKIRGMWNRDEFVSRATDVLLEPGIRRMIETMVLGPLSIPDIARRVRLRFNLPDTVMNTAVVKAYMHYYWDDTALSAEEWRQFAHFWIEGYNNDLLMALNAPRSAAGAAITIAAADRGGGQSVNSVAMYATIRDQGFKMFMEHALNDAPSMVRTQGAMFALQIITQAEEELDRRRGGSAELLEELHKIETAYDDRKLHTAKDLPTVRQLPESVVDVDGEVIESEPDSEEEPA